MFRGSSVESVTGRGQTCRNRNMFAWLKAPKPTFEYASIQLLSHSLKVFFNSHMNHTTITSLLLVRRRLIVQSRSVQLSMLMTPSSTSAAHKPSFFHHYPPPHPPPLPFCNVLNCDKSQVLLIGAEREQVYQSYFFIASDMSSVSSSHITPLLQLSLELQVT